jgi:hypothetical protein
VLSNSRHTLPPNLPSHLRRRARLRLTAGPAEFFGARRTLGFRYRQQSTKRALVDWDQRLTLSLGFDPHRRAGALLD